jgi:L-ascorbate metabolism protein UlaG (beta-lactamase superfamily)
MKITWRGHASFLIETGISRIVTDPFNEHIGYPVPDIAADIVTVSHQHWDHNATETVAGNPDIVTEGVYEKPGIVIKGIPSFHDKNSGRDRGPNMIFCLQSQGINLVHLGDLGHIPHPEQIKAMGPVDILLIPVGGRYTIDADEAYTTVEMIKPHIVIPMHYKTANLTINIAPVELFTSRFDLVVKKPFLELEHQDLKEGTQVIVLDYIC